MSSSLILPRLTIAISVALLFTVVGVHSTPAQALCPRGANWDDGCQQSPGGVGGPSGTLVQFPDFFKGYANQSGQTYVKRPPWDVAGVDYPVGIPAGIALRDPALAQPENCNYNPTGNDAGGPLLRCSGSSPTVSHYEFGPVGGHACTKLLMNNSVTGIETITYNHFSNCPGNNIVETQSGSRANVIFSNNVVNGDWNANPEFKPGGVIVLYTSGSLTEEYNAVMDMAFRPQGAGCTICDTIGDLTIRYNFFSNFANTRGSSHGEIMEQTFSRAQQTTQNKTIYSFNTILQPKTALEGQSTATIYASGGGAPKNPIYQDVVVDHNTEVTNLDNGKITTATAGATISNGTYNSFRLIDNYIDKSGSYYSFLCQGSNTILPKAPVISGNFNMVTGEAIDALTNAKCIISQ